jgi:hypothetical protein
VPLKEAREHLAIMFEDHAERADVVAAYDHLEDAIVFNSEHVAWPDMRGFMRRAKERGFYSTTHPQHIVRHELGHAAHYRALSSPVRERIWYAENLAPNEIPVAGRVSAWATWSPKEFVAEVFAGLWAGVDYDDGVLGLFEQYGGQRP